MIKYFKFSIVLGWCLCAWFLNLAYGCQGQDVHQIDENSSCVKYFDTALNAFVFEKVEKMPEFEGGQDALLKFISINLKKTDSQEEIQGKICIEFIITEDGKVVNETICNKSPENYTKLDKSGIELIRRTSKKWMPGECNNLKVAFKYVLPIYIR